MASLLEVILGKIKRAGEPGGEHDLQEAHRLLSQLHTSVLTELEDPLQQIAKTFRACEHDLERAELLYSSGFTAGELAQALDLSLRRVYQLLRLARLPIPLKNEIRAARISERQLRPMLRQITLNGSLSKAQENC